MSSGSPLSRALQKILLVVSALPFLLNLALTVWIGGLLHASGSAAFGYIWILPAAWLVSLYLGSRASRKLVSSVDAFSLTAASESPASRPPVELSDLARSLEGLKSTLVRLRRENENLQILSQRKGEIELLSTLSAEFAETQGLESLYRTLVTTVRDFFHCDLAVLSMVDESGLCRAMEWAGGKKPGPVGEHWRKLAPLTRLDGDALPSRFPGRLEAGQWTSYAAVTIGAPPRGLLELFYSGADSLDDEGQLVLATVARVADMAESNWRHYAQLRQEKSFVERILASMSEGVLSLDGQGRILSVNPAALRILGQSRAQLEGKSVETLLGAPWPNRDTPFEVVLGGRTLEFVPGLARAGNLPDGPTPVVVAVFRDVTRLRELEDLRSDFTATLSHELRTPLTAMKGYLQTLMHRKAREFDHDKIQGIVAIVNHQADRLNRLIMDLLEAARLKSQALVVHPQPNDISQLIDASLVAQGQTRSEMVTQKPDSCRVLCDAEQVLFVLSHLLSNAQKYSVPGGRIEVSCQEREDWARVSIRDEGVGIPLEQQERIFEMYHRLDTGTTRSHYGVGLGLFLARRIVEAHGGEIGVESTPGCGSTFYFTLQREKAGDAPASLAS